MLIADDEQIIREGILHIVDWSAYDIEIVGAARDGEQARAMYEAHRPEIVMTDIRMPKLDGLELMQHIRCVDEEAKVIVLSGYDEFAYAQQAVRYGAADYLLKPAMPDVLVAKVLEIKEQVSRLQQEREEQRRLHNRLNEGLPLLRERFLRELAAGSIAERSLIEEKARYLQLQLSPALPCCAIVIDLDGRGAPDPGGHSEAALYAARAELEEQCGLMGEVFVLSAGQLAWIAQFAELQDGVDSPVLLKQLCGELQSRLAARFGADFSFGIGTRSLDGQSLPASFQSAIAAVKRKTITGLGSIILADELTQPQDGALACPEDSEPDLLKAMRNGDRDGIEAAVRQALSPALQRNEVDYAVLLGMKLLDNVSREWGGLASGKKEGPLPEYELWQQLKRQQTLPDLAAEVSRLLQEAAARRTEGDRADAGQQRWVGQIIAHLEEHYQEPLSLKRLSELVFLSPNYICSLFKEETGQTISDYLTRLRIDRAKRLLSEHGIKVYEVANAVGYTDSRYFNKVFKKYTGMNLSEYRSLGGDGAPR